MEQMRKASRVKDESESIYAPLGRGDRIDPWALKRVTAPLKKSRLKDWGLGEGVGTGMSHCPHDKIEAGGSAKMVSGIGGLALVRRI